MRRRQLRPPFDVAHRRSDDDISSTRVARSSRKSSASRSLLGTDFEMPAAASGLRVVRGRQPTPSERADDEGVSGAPSSTANTALVNRQGRRKRSKVGARSADRPGSDRRLRACCPGSMRGQLGRGRYRLGRRPVSPRDGAARVEAQCTVRPAQAGAAEEWWPASAARGDQAWLKRSAWEADGARAQACAACRLHVHARSSRRRSHEL